MKKIIILLMLVVLVFTMVACKDDSLVGQWYEEDSSLFMKFNSDNTCEFGDIEEGDMTQAEYKTEDEKLILMLDGEEQIMSYYIDGNELEIVFDENETEEFRLYFKKVVK